MLCISYQVDGALREQTFPEDRMRILIGRDPATCDVVLDTALTMVGREHCALERKPGGYVLSVLPRHPVLGDGRALDDGEALAIGATLRLGAGGPLLTVTWTQAADLPPTIDQGDVAPGLHDQLRAVRRRQSLQLIAVVLVFAGLGAVLWWRAQAWSSTDQAIASNRAELAQLMEEHARLLQESKLRPIPAAAVPAGASPPLRIQDQVQLARRSVCLVVRVDARGGESGVGTAWMAGPGVLATNAHVAGTFRELGEGERLVVRASTAGFPTWPVRSVRIHPGFDRFTALWASYRPTSGGAPISSAGAACDVAAMMIEPAPDQPPPLVLAPDDRLPRLAPGEAVGYAGYPMEHLALGGTMLAAPNPQVQLGYITALSDFFGRPSHEDAARRQLVQHNLPATGGASGSPLIDERGQVVAILSAANFIHTAEARIPIGGVNFAQRADLIRQILAGDIPAEQVAALESGWKHDLSASYGSTRGEARTEVLARWRKAVAGAAEPACLIEERVRLEPAKGGMCRHERQLELGRGSYLLLTVPAAAMEIDVDAAVLDVKRKRVVAKDTGRESHAVCAFELEESTIVGLLAISARDASAECDLWLYAVVPKVP